jgi:UDP-N-acetylmuramate: L-alanyl-gamma-D-glutamyl-meso-diaminopimelate ligase
LRCGGIALHAVRDGISPEDSGEFQYPQRGDGGFRRAILWGAAPGYPGGHGDFGHHPTAIRETLAGLRRQYAGSRIWAVFEPRSNTTRRAVFQHELPAAFALADGAILAKVAKLEQIPEAERLRPEQVVAEIAATGKPAFYEPDVEQIIGRVKELARTGDIVAVFSNGGFENIHSRLLAAL